MSLVLINYSFQILVMDILGAQQRHPKNSVPISHGFPQNMYIKFRNSFLKGMN